MKFRWNHRYVQLGVTAFLVIAASILFYYGIFHMKSLISRNQDIFRYYGSDYLWSSDCISSYTNRQLSGEEDIFADIQKA